MQQLFCTLSDEENDMVDTFSDKSGKTHVIDEVLHQQKTEAYRELSSLKQVENAGGSSKFCRQMGRIIEQDDEF